MRRQRCRTVRLRSLLLPLALLALAAGLTGCGVAGTIDPVAGAATKSKQAGSAKVSLRVDVDGYEVTGAGAFAEDAGEMTLDLGNLPLAQLPSGGGGPAVKVL